MIRLVAWMGAGVAAVVWSLAALLLFVFVSFVEGVFEGTAALVSVPLGGIDFGVGWLSDLLGDIGQVSVILIWLFGLAGIWFTKRLLTGRNERVRPVSSLANIYEVPQTQNQSRAELTLPVLAHPSAPTRVSNQVETSALSELSPSAKVDVMQMVKGIAKGKNHGNQA